MNARDPFLPEEVKTLLRAVIDVTLSPDLAAVPLGPVAREHEAALQASMRSREPPTPEQVREARAAVRVANVLAHVAEGRPLPTTGEAATAAKLLNQFATRLR